MEGPTPVFAKVRSVDSDASIKAVQDLLDHKQITTTQIYDNFGGRSGIPRTRLRI
jgi:hypothetical protein